MVEDEFFRQLSQGALADPPADARAAGRPGSERASRDRREAPREEVAGDAEHAIVQPLLGADPPRPQRRSQTRRAPKTDRAQRAAVRGHRLERRPARRRVLATIALGAATVALAIIIGASQGTTASAPDKPAEGDGEARAVAKAILRVSWRGARSDTVSEQWRSGASKTVVGRLLSPDGKPIVGASISVLAADAGRPEHGNRTVGELRTDRAGRFGAPVALDRGAPRKRLTFIYLARPGDTVPTAQARAALAVYAPVSASAATKRVRRGKTVSLRGRSAPGAKIGLLISQPAARAWRRLTTARADRDGRWKATVRIARRSSTGRYGFRARVAASQALGFLAARSRPVDVVVE